MYSFLMTASLALGKVPLQAQPKGEEHYQWHLYRGAKPVTLEFRGNPEVIKKGDKFGVRKSANGKNIRLILPDEETRVFTLSQEQANALARGIQKGGTKL
jgi:hypothetical protein